METTLRLAAQIREAALEGAAGRLLLLRAAGVATPSGAVLGLISDDPDLRAVTAAELSRRGFAYVAAELLALDESFDVAAFPEPIAFEQSGAEPAALAGPDALGLRPSPRALHLTAVVLLDRQATAAEPQLARVHRPHDVRRLEPAVLSAPGDWALTAVPDLVDEVDGIWELTYHDLEQALPLLAELLTERSRPTMGPTQLYVAVGVAETPGEVPSRSPISGHDLALDGLRRAVWLAAAGGASLENLHHAANRDLGGEHHISVQLVAAAVRDLMGLGLLVPEQGSVRAYAQPA